MATFSFSDLDQFAGSSTSIRRPREFTHFSYDADHCLHPVSTDSLSYYYPPVFGAPGTRDELINLSAGFDSFVQRDDSSDEHLDGLLDTLQAHEEQLLQCVNDGGGKLEDIKTQADVITWRGMMTKILTAAFDMYNEFEMNATCYQGTIFIEENHQRKIVQRNDQHGQRPRRGAASQEMMQYWGYKFETLSVLPKPWAECTRQQIEGRMNQVVNNNAQYCSIVRTGIGNTSLVIAGEVDAVLGEKPDNPNDQIPWIELKTTFEPPSSHWREAAKYEGKLLKFWAQSFLLGVPTVMVGFRNQDGRLLRISELRTQRIPSQVKQGSKTWDGNVCINMTSAVLDFLKQTVTGEGVWRIRRIKGRSMIEVFKIEEAGTGEIVKPSFKTHREKLQALEIVAALGK